MYVFDTNAFSQLFHSYYPKRFPTLWAKFGALLEREEITSTREVGRECEDDRVEVLRDRFKDHPEMFPASTAEEAQFVAEVFKIKHFQQVIEQKKLERGGKNADPFVVACAKILTAIAVTMELKQPNGARIPNICDHFGISCTSFEGFMELEKWSF